MGHSCNVGLGLKSQRNPRVIHALSRAETPVPRKGNCQGFTLPSPQQLQCRNPDEPGLALLMEGRNDFRPMSSLCAETEENERLPGRLLGRL